MAESIVPVIHLLNVSQIERGQISRFWLELTASGLGNPLRVPLIVARGWEEGPILGIAAAVHGNALNGLPVVRQLFQNLDMASLRGTIVGIPTVNMPGFLRQQRPFLDGADLNQAMPGRQGGGMSEMYTFRLMDRLVSYFDYLVDIQTADFGQINAFHVRVDMSLTKPAIMARLTNPPIVLHDPGYDGGLRRAAADLDIQSISIVAGSPHRFEQNVIVPARDGLLNLLAYLEMQEGEIESPAPRPIECLHGYWLFTQQAGILEVYPEVGEEVQRGETIGRLTNVFGDLLREYPAPEIGIVLCKSIHPVSQAGARILYLGIPKKEPNTN